MTESPFGGLSYIGSENEAVTVDVTAQGTAQMVDYTLDGASQPLPAGQKITFSLKRKPGNAPTLLQIDFDFSNPAGGRYEVVLTSVNGYPGNASPRTVEQFGANPDSRTYIFNIQ